LFEPDSVESCDCLPPPGRYALTDLKPAVDFAQFEATLRRIRQHLADGETYQVNYTFPVQGRFAGSPLDLFGSLVAAQGGCHGVFVRAGRFTVCSASPELFFARNGTELRARPMKGTAARGRTTAEDERQRDLLLSSDKQRAENVMIVDMVRNDLGRIAAVGSVEVPELFAAERYPNVWQMTSLVTARSSVGLADIFRALHPSASVTGAPKIRTMQILRDLERRPRGVYCGAVGHVAPGGSARFNVAIRTAVVDHANGSVEFGLGSGIVWDSSAVDEYQECLLKGSILSARPRAFELLETLRWSPDTGFFLLDRHLARLCDSAAYFGFACSVQALREALARAVEGEQRATRVRLLLSRDGRVHVERAPLVPGPPPLRVALAVEPIDNLDVFLFHKTTNRDVYEQARLSGYDETILWNPLGEVTEATTANIVVELNGRLVTPPVRCGLLAGTYRAELLSRGDLREAVVTIDDLAAAAGFWLINSVHEWREAVLESRPRRTAGVPG
jgi:para-aminobenzoate synthetase/4-amino-4-deoxychorismate lyase